MLEEAAQLRRMPFQQYTFTTFYVKYETQLQTFWEMVSEIHVFF